MKLEELNEFQVRKKGIVVHVVPRRKSKIILPDEKDTATIKTHKFILVKKGNDVDDLEIGDELFVVGQGASFQLDLEDVNPDDREAYFYTEESFVKLYKRTDGTTE